MKSIPGTLFGLVSIFLIFAAFVANFDKSHTRLFYDFVIAGALLLPPASATTLYVGYRTLLWMSKAISAVTNLRVQIHTVFGAIDIIPVMPAVIDFTVETGVSYKLHGGSSSIYCISTKVSHIFGPDSDRVDLPVMVYSNVCVSPAVVSANSSKICGIIAKGTSASKNTGNSIYELLAANMANRFSSAIVGLTLSYGVNIPSTLLQN